jgi:hypothetical protein
VRDCACARARARVVVVISMHLHSLHQTIDNTSLTTRRIARLAGNNQGKGDAVTEAKPAAEPAAEPAAAPPAAKVEAEPEAERTPEFVALPACRWLDFKTVSATGLDPSHDTKGTLSDPCVEIPNLSSWQDCVVHKPLV